MLSILIVICCLFINAVSFTPSYRNNRSPIKLPDISEKLVFEKKTGRFYERDLSDLNEEEFCLIDNDSGKPILLTKEEKERIFLDAIQSYYFNGKSNLPDDQFNKLKEDLSWEGSALVTLNRNETMFLNAMQAFQIGKPIMTDKAFDELKLSLKENGSKLAAQTEPKCYVDTGVCKVTWTKDSIRSNSLYIPASLMGMILFLGTTYEVLDVLFQLSINPILLLIAGVYPVGIVSKVATENFLFKDPLVAGGPCPKCSVENKVFFGDVLGVVGDADESTIKCTNCKTMMTVKRSSLRVSTLAKPKGPPVKAGAGSGDDE